MREEADEVARAAAGESDERVAEEAADVLYHLEVLLLSRDVPLARGAGGAQWPSPLSPARRSSPTSTALASSPATANVIPVAYRFVDDCETPVSAFLKLREAFAGPVVPARVRRAGPARALLVPRLPPAARAALGRRAR